MECPRPAFVHGVRDTQVVHAKSALEFRPILCYHDHVSDRLAFGPLLALLGHSSKEISSRSEGQNMEGGERISFDKFRLLPFVIHLSS